MSMSYHSDMTDRLLEIAEGKTSRDLALDFSRWLSASQIEEFLVSYYGIDMEEEKEAEPECDYCGAELDDDDCNFVDDARLCDECYFAVTNEPEPYAQGNEDERWRQHCKNECDEDLCEWCQRVQ